MIKNIGKKYNVDVKKDVPIAITAATSAGYILAKGAETLLKAPTSEIPGLGNAVNGFIAHTVTKGVGKIIKHECKKIAKRKKC